MYAGLARVASWCPSHGDGIVAVMVCRQTVSEAGQAQDGSRTGSSVPQAATAPSLELYPARDSLINAIWLRWRQRHSDQAVAEDVLQLARVVLQLDGGRSDSAFDLTTLALQLAPVWGTPTHTSALLLRGQWCQ